MFKLLLDRDPLTGEDLASQPTLSRFENWVSSTELYAMGMAMSKKVVAYHKKRLGRRRVRRVTIDMDPTDTATYGGQQLTFFNAHYGHYCYLPMLGFLTFNDEPEQYLFAAMLRSGTTPASQGAIALLRRIIAQVRKAFPKAKLRIVYKAEVPRLEGREPRDNPRFVVTNMRYKPETVYQIYRMRGESENRIKELLIGLELDRMSCSSFKANQLRILLTAAAYMLI